jgi:two-component system response regulator AtoC
VGLQAKLLHVLQDREFTKLGSNRPVSIDVRVIAATNRDLGAMLRAGQFREDLYYRLQVIEIRVPPLRQRREEIPALLEFFLRRFSERYGRPILRPSASVQKALADYAWPGNVRELENTIKRFIILRDEALLLADLRREPLTDPATGSPGAVASPAPPPARVPVTTAPPVIAGSEAALRRGKLPELARAAAITAETEAIQQALDRFRWNRRKTAQQLGVSYKTLLNKMKECGIRAPSGTETEEA